MGVYQIRVKQEYVGQEVLNVFYYEDDSGSPSADDLLDVFTDDVWDAARGVQSDGVNTVEFYCINIGTPSDYAIRADDSNGVLTGTSGQNLPPFVAYAFRSPNPGPGKRFSYKRIAGVRSGVFSSSGNGQFSDSFLDVLYPAQQAFGAYLEGALAGYRPVQVTGAVVLGTTPTISHSLFGQWQTNKWFSSQKTRQDYLWQATAAP